jgi:hypothetical protein
LVKTQRFLPKEGQSHFLPLKTVQEGMVNNNPKAMSSKKSLLLKLCEKRPLTMRLNRISDSSNILNFENV